MTFLRLLRPYQSSGQTADQAAPPVAVAGESQLVAVLALIGTRRLRLAPDGLDEARVPVAEVRRRAAGLTLAGHPELSRQTAAQL